MGKGRRTNVEGKKGSEKSERSSIWDVMKTVRSLIRWGGFRRIGRMDPDGGKISIEGNSTGAMCSAYSRENRVLQKKLTCACGRSKFAKN